LRIPVGSYSLRVEAKGFQTTLFSGVHAGAHQTARIDVQIRWTVTETVEVTAATRYCRPKH